MPSSTFQVVDEWANYESKKVIDCVNDVFKLVATNTPPSKAGTQVLADITPLSTANGYAPVTVTQSWAETGAGTGVWRFTGNADVTWTGTGGSFGPFRYLVLYDDTPASSPTDPIVGYFDYGSAVTVANGEVFTLDLDANFAYWTKTVN